MENAIEHRESIAALCKIIISCVVPAIVDLDIHLEEVSKVVLYTSISI